MNSCHVLAGIVPPATCDTPLMPSNGRGLSASPIQMAVDSAGVYPTNQASLHSWAVPVLPAAGRPMSAARPVPLVMTPRRTAVTLSETISLSTRDSCGLVWSSSTCPRLANTEYADAMSSGETSWAPSPMLMP